MIPVPSYPKMNEKTMMAPLNLYIYQQPVPIAIQRVQEFEKVISDVQSWLKKHGTNLRTGSIPAAFVTFMKQYLRFEPGSMDEGMYYAQCHQFSSVSVWVYDWYRKWDLKYESRRYEVPELLTKIKIPYPVYRIHPRLWNWPTKENEEALNAIAKIWALMKQYVPWLMEEIERRIRVGHGDFVRNEERWYKGSSPPG